MRRQADPQGGDGSGSAEPVGVVQDTRTPIEKRRDVACDELAPRLTQCAVDDAKADAAAGKISKDQLAKDTGPEILRKNTEEAKKACKVDLSSRQVRVIEVCTKEETECAALQDCLGHLNDGGNK
ncbi:hypothetical protein BH11MYX3_BH11MYX3_04770 [soil metagenome]